MLARATGRTAISAKRGWYWGDGIRDSIEGVWDWLSKAFSRWSSKGNLNQNEKMAWFLAVAAEFKKFEPVLKCFPLSKHIECYFIDKAMVFLNIRSYPSFVTKLKQNLLCYCVSSWKWKTPGLQYLSFYTLQNVPGLSLTKDILSQEFFARIFKRLNYWHSIVLFVRGVCEELQIMWARLF